MFREATRVVNRSKIRLLSQGATTIFKLNNINSCTTRTLIHTNMKRLVFVSGSDISVSGMGQRLITSTDALNHLGTSIVTRQTLQIGPSYSMRILPICCDPNSESFVRGLRTSFVVSTVSSIPTGVSVIYRYSELRVPIVSSVKANGHLHPRVLRVASVCGASMYRLTQGVEGVLGRGGVHRLPIICSGRIPYGVINRSRIPKSMSFIPPISNVVVTKCIIQGLLRRRVPGRKWRTILTVMW